MQYGIVHSALLISNEPIPERWALRLCQYKREIADIIGYEGQSRGFPCEVIGGCKVVWLPTSGRNVIISGATFTTTHKNVYFRRFWVVEKETQETANARW